VVVGTVGGCGLALVMLVGCWLVGPVLGVCVGALVAWVRVVGA
jgi:hypothetical protein